MINDYKNKPKMVELKLLNISNYLFNRQVELNWT